MTVKGTVVAGRGIGRTLGYPTANLRCQTRLTVKHGVYAARVWYRGKQYNALLVLAAIPNLPSPSIEVHLLDFSGDLYAEALEVEVLEKVSEIKQLESDEQLKAKIESDIAKARMMLKEIK